MTQSCTPAPGLTALAALLLGVLAVPANAACRDELVASQQQLAATRAGLHSVASRPEAEQCPAFRRHYAAMAAVRRVFAQCDTGVHGAEQAAQLDGLIEAFRKQMPPGCRP